MFCTNCGMKTEYGAVFCVQCGTRLEDGSSTATARIVSTSTLTTVESKSKPEAEREETVSARAMWESRPVTKGAPPPPPPLLRQPQTAQQVYSSPSSYQRKNEKESLPAWTIALIVALVFVVLALGVGGILTMTGVISLNSPRVETDTSREPAETSDGSERDSSSDGTGGDADSDSASSSSSGSSDTDNLEIDGTTNTDSVYIIEDSASRALSESDLAGLTDDELSIAQNEIWARHGRLFQNQWLQNHFDAQSWYKGTIPADQFLDRYTPTAIEEANAALIIGILNSHGYDVNKAHPN